MDPLPPAAPRCPPPLRLAPAPRPCTSPLHLARSPACQVHTLAFASHEAASRWRQLLAARVEQTEQEIVHEMRVALAWFVDEAAPRGLHLPDARAAHAAEAAARATPLALRVMLTPAQPAADARRGSLLGTSLGRSGEAALLVRADGERRASGGPASVVGPQPGRGTLARQELERAALLNPQLHRTRPVLAAFFAIKGSVLWKLTKGGLGEGHPRLFRLFPSDSTLQWDSAEPLVLLGARAGFSQPATRAVRPSRELAQRAFRFVLAGSEVDVVARSVVERDLWLLAVQSLPIGAAYVGKVEIQNKWNPNSDTGLEGTSFDRWRESVRVK